MCAPPHLRAPWKRAMESLATKNMLREQDTYMQSKNKANKSRFIQAYKMIIEMTIITTFNMFEAY